MTEEIGELLLPQLVTWARDNGWKQFTPVQRRSTRIILQDNCDLIIGGPTSSGKTEAAFLPLITQAQRRRSGVSVLYIIPTRSLSNDQHRRLQSMVRHTDVRVCKWHGEASDKGKKDLLKDPRGIVLITPESLEGRFIRAPSAKHLFSDLDAIVIDELHLFLSGPRGHQLASLLARLEQLALRRIRKIALTATLGDPEYAKKWLSPANPAQVRHLDAAVPAIPVRWSIRGYEAPVSQDAPRGRRRLQARQSATLGSIAAVISENHRADTALVFAGSRKTCETLCAHLKARAANDCSEDRYHVHHGSTSKQVRENIEERLRNGEPTTLITTSTLEVGVDIPSVDLVEQIGAPRTLAALRQRVGRSGRRDNPARLRIHVTEEPVGFAVSLLDQLRLNTVRAIAALNLLQQRFVEPPEADGTMLSVVLHQTLSHVRHERGTSFADLARLMRSVTPFQRLPERSYGKLVAELCNPGLALLQQSEDGKYHLSSRGEKLFESFEIYAAFPTVVSWDVCFRNEAIGILPRSTPIEVGYSFRLSGRAWQVVSVYSAHDRIQVEPSSSGVAPYFNVSGNDDVHPRLAEEMRQVLAGKMPCSDCCDPVAKQFLMEGRSAFDRVQLRDRALIDESQQDMCHLFTWKGSRHNYLLATLLRFKRFACDHNEAAVSVSTVNSEHVLEALTGELPDVEELSRFVECINVGKFDKWLPEELLREDWAKRHAELMPDVLSFCRALG